MQWQSLIPYSAKHWQGKHRQIWQLSIDLPRFSHPNIVNTLKYNGKPTQFAKVLPSNYMSRVISPKFHPANILRYTVADGKKENKCPDSQIEREGHLICMSDLV